MLADASVFALPKCFRIFGRDVDALLLVSFLLLLSMGVTMVASASIDYAAYRFNDPFLFIRKHVVFVLIGLLCFSLAFNLPVRFWRSHASLFLVLSLVLLVVVLVPGIGKKVNGSQRWLSLGFLTLQVSEVAKVFVIFYLASFIVRRRQEFLSTMWGFIKSMLVIFVVVFLLLLEPDFGAAMVVLVSSLGVVFVAGVPLFRFMLMLGASACMAVLIAILEPYRLKRLSTFMDPWADDVKFDGGYQLTQSLIAFGRGEWIGLGLGNSIQKLFFLPEAHTDFVFSIWAEEAGLLGVLLVLALFLLMTFRMLNIAVRAQKCGEQFMALAVSGFTLILIGQVFINVGVASGLLPTKGLTLPFISYGGSSLMVCCFMVGVVLRSGWELEALYGAEQPSEKKLDKKIRQEEVEATQSFARSLLSKTALLVTSKGKQA